MADAEPGRAATMTEMTTAVHDHAKAHYHEGWAVIWDCWAPCDLADVIRRSGAVTPAAAVAAVRQILSPSPSPRP
jgi:hypothetical protein